MAVLPPKPIADDLPEELTLPLRKPVQLGDAVFTELRLREPTAEEWARWDQKQGVEADIMSIAAVSGLPEAAVRKIGTRDLIAASRYLARFLA